MAFRTLVLVGVVCVLIALGMGVAVGFNYSQQKTSTFTQTLPASTQVESTTYTTTVVKSLPNGTILVVIQKTGTKGGGGYCAGSTVESCVGLATLQLTVETLTSYVLPSISGDFNATIETTTSYGVITCVSPRTTTTTVTQNSTYVFLTYTWTASCSG